MTLLYLADTDIVLQGGDEPFVYDAHGCRWQWGGEKLWSSSPAPKIVTGDNANGHGSWDGTEFYAALQYPLEGLVHARTHDDLHAAERRFNAAVGLGFHLRCVEPGADRGGWFRRDGKTSWTELSQRVARFSVPLWARDPRAYSTAVQTASTGFPATVGGLSLPTTVPFLLDAVSSSGDMNMVNDGNETAWPIYRIDPSGTDPVVDPVIVDTVTGQAMRFALTIGPGEWLTIDTETHEVLGNGDVNASRRNAFHGDWFGLTPGNNTVRYSGAFGVGSTLSAQWRHTDI